MAGDAQRHGIVAVGDSLLGGYGLPLAGVTCRSWAGWLAWALVDCLTLHAVNGATCEQVARDQLPLVTAEYRIGAVWCGANDLADLKPDQAAQALSRVCERLQSHCAVVALATLPASLRVPVLHWKAIDARRVIFNELLREVATAFGCVLVELDTALDEPYSMAPDHQHPTAIGNLRAATVAAHALAAARVSFARHLPDPALLAPTKEELRLYDVSVRERLRGAWAGLRAPGR